MRTDGLFETDTSNYFSYLYCVRVSDGEAGENLTAVCILFVLNTFV